MIGRWWKRTKKGALLLDYAPHSSSLRDIVRVEQFMLSEA